MWARRPPCRRAADETPIAHAARHADAPTPPEGPRWAAAARALGKVVNAWRTRGARDPFALSNKKWGMRG